MVHQMKIGALLHELRRETANDIGHANIGYQNMQSGENITSSF